MTGQHRYDSTNTVAGSIVDRARPPNGQREEIADAALLAELDELDHGLLALVQRDLRFERALTGNDCRKRVRRENAKHGATTAVGPLAGDCAQRSHEHTAMHVRARTAEKSVGTNAPKHPLEVTELLHVHDLGCTEGENVNENGPNVQAELRLRENATTERKGFDPPERHRVRIVASGTLERPDKDRASMVPERVREVRQQVMLCNLVALQQSVRGEQRKEDQSGPRVQEQAKAGRKPKIEAARAALAHAVDE
eukprot:Amastigsp_a847562_9.p2 type:complete len:253 gc:universal Amastigsp_a847562_9:808-50(-)